MAFWPFTRRKKTDDEQARPARAPPAMDEKTALVSPRPAKPMTAKSRSALPRSAHTSVRDSPRSSRPTTTKSAVPAGETVTKRKTLVKKQSNASRTSLGRDEDFTAVPTLKPSTHDGKSLRSKKSIRSKGDKERIKSLRESSSPISIARPLSNASGDIMVRESRRAPGGIGRPASQVSLPLVESLNDEYVPNMPESASYKLNAFDIFAPHPTIRYTNNPKLEFARKDKEPMISEGDFGPKARINEMADDMDAKALRELMDRDRRRRERKRKLDTEKLARELEKKDEKEKSRRTRSKGKGKGKEKVKDSGRPGTSSRDVQRPAPRSRSPTPEALPTLSGPLGDNPFLDQSEAHELPVSPVHQKFRESRYSPVSPVGDPFSEVASHSDDRDDPIIETATAVRLSQASMSPPSSPILATKVPVRNPERLERYDSATPDIPEETTGRSSLVSSPEPPRRDSEASGKQTGGGWASFFRRTKTKARSSSERGRNTPSESGYSNTSRESFAARTGQSSGPLPSGLMASSQRNFRRGAAPQRTQSKFREELPDVPKVPEVPAIPANVITTGLPLSPPRSPPMSRGASPDLSSPPSPFVDRPEMMSTDAAVNAPMELVHPALRGEVALSRHQSMRSSQGFNGNNRDSGPSAALLSQSLASVDSEGSWISGRPSKRSSSITERNARSASRSSARDSVDQENQRGGSPLLFGRRISNPGQQPGLQAQNPGTGSLSTQLRQLRRPESAGTATGPTPEHSKPPTPIPFAEGQTHEHRHAALDKGDAVLYTGGIARTPTLVKRDRAAITRSREGLLDIFDPHPQPSSGIIESGADDDSYDRRASMATARPISPVSMSADQEHPSTVTSRRESGQPESAEGDGDGEEVMQVAEVQVAEITQIKRATSVSLRDRQHARHISGGSARLLELPARNSGEMRRGKRESVDTPITPRIPAEWREESQSPPMGEEKVKEKEVEGGGGMTKGVQLFD